MEIGHDSSRFLDQSRIATVSVVTIMWRGSALGSNAVVSAMSWTGQPDTFVFQFEDVG